MTLALVSLLRMIGEYCPSERSERGDTTQPVVQGALGRVEGKGGCNGKNNYANSFGMVI